MSEQNTQALQVVDRHEMSLDVAGRKAAIDDLLNKVALVMEVMKRVMKDGEHYGKIPGCGDKPALLKAGAEKLGMTFRLRPQFQINERDLGHAHREYSVKCTLSDGTEGVGSCSTMESKYRFRTGPKKPTGKPVPKEYWNVRNTEPAKAQQLLGGKGFSTMKDENGGWVICEQGEKVENDNPADCFNTCLKMAKKRAHVDAIITATACSDIFTQDVEEMVEQADASRSTEPIPVQTPSPTPAAPQATTDAPKQTQAAPRREEKRAITKETVLPSCRILMLTEKKGTAASTGKPWTMHLVLIDDGVGEIEAATFSDSIANIAHQSEQEGLTCKIVVKPGRKQGTNELVSIEPIQPVQGELVTNATEDDVPM